MNNGPNIPSLLGAVWNFSLELDRSDDRDNTYQKDRHELAQFLSSFPAKTPTSSALWKLFNLHQKNREEILLIRKTVCVLAQTLFEMNRANQNYSDVVFAQPSFVQPAPLADNNGTEQPPQKRLKMMQE